VTQKNSEAKNKKRQYPVVYEKAIPIAIAVLALLILGILVLTIGIATGWISAG
jgi:hypothetical protein